MRLADDIHYIGELKPKRIKLIRFSADFLVGLVTTGNRINAKCIDGIPPESKIVGTCESNGYLGIFIEHESFPEVTLADDLKPMFRSYYCDQCGKDE